MVPGRGRARSCARPPVTGRRSQSGQTRSPAARRSTHSTTHRTPVHALAGLASNETLATAVTVARTSRIDLRMHPSYRRNGCSHRSDRTSEPLVTRLRTCVGERAVGHSGASLRTREPQRECWVPRDKIPTKKARPKPSLSAILVTDKGQAYGQQASL